MVLEEATQSSDSFNDNPFPSDDDRYSSSDAQARLPTGITIDTSQFPRPMPIIGPLTGYSEAAMNKSAQKFVGGFQTMAQRPLTEEEATIIAYYSAKMRATASWGDGLGILVGATRAYQTSAAWKFPLRKAPDLETFNPDKFGPLRGQVARVVHHSLRYGAYMFLGNMAMGFLAMNYGMAVAAVSIKTDPRLKRLNEAIDSTRKEKAAAASRNQGELYPGVPRPRPVGAREPSQAQDGDAGSRWASTEDDMSPTAGADDFQTSSTYDSQRRTTPSQQQTGYQYPSRQPASSPSSSSSSSSFDSDSPTGGFGPVEPSTRAGSSSGSAWDRIRKQSASGERPPQNASGGPGGQQGAGGQKSDSSDSFF